MLVLSTLQNTLETQWLVPASGEAPPSAFVSGQRFARAVAGWFGAAQALGFPCATAAAREPQLAALAGAALAHGSAEAAGGGLALAVAAYVAGQSFGSGAAAFPLATPAAGTQLVAVFSDLQAPLSARAQKVAAACDLIARSAVVVFPNPPWSGPIV